MNFCIEKDSLYQPLQKIVNIISNRPRLSILKHVLLEISHDHLFITATDLEIEITAYILLEEQYPCFSITVSGHKFFDICRNLPEHAKLFIEVKGNKFFVNSGNSSFVLSTLPTEKFPKTKKRENTSDLVISQYILKKMIKLTQFAMGKQDIRHYLNGILLETENNTIRIVATDGYRLAMCTVISDVLLSDRSVIIPRKGIIEILQLLYLEKELVNIGIYSESICISVNNYVFTVKLIDSKFPNYHTVFPDCPKFFFEVERIALKQALYRASILSNIKLRIVNLDLSSNQLKISTCNFEQEKSEEILSILYSDISITISFNVDYLLDIINVIDTKILKFFITNTVSGVQIEGVPKNYGATYILMPVRI